MNIPNSLWVDFSMKLLIKGANTYNPIYASMNQWLKQLRYTVLKNSERLKVPVAAEMRSGHTIVQNNI